MPPTRILFHVPSLNVGGVEMNLLEIVERLDRREFLPFVWCTEGRGSIASKLEALGVTVHHQPFDFTEPDDANHCTALLRHLRPVIFHSMSYRQNCSDVLSAVLAEIPFLLTSRQNMRHWDPCLTVQSWELIRNRLTDVVIANAEAVALRSVEVERLPPAKVRVIRNGVRIPRETNRSHDLRRELNLSPDTLLVANVGNLKKVKGHESLLRAWAQVVSCVPPSHLIICGADYGLRPELERLTKALSIDASVSFLGAYDNMERLYRGIDVYVQSSTAEAISLALLEAMSYGCPVVATSVGGTNEAVHDGTSGLLVPPADPAALATSIVQLLRDPDLRQTIGAAARQQVIAEFNVERVMREHEAVYRLLTR